MLDAEKFAFTMRLKPGAAEEYERRHDALWPELRDALKAAGISDYSIFLGPDEQTLFAVLRRPADHGMATLPEQPIMKRWWAYMADLMETHPDNAPVAEPLRPVFYLA